MKLGKGTVLAIIECALFFIGAIFFLLMLISPASPIWMLIIGISCGLAGIALWVCPPLVRLITKVSGTNKQTRHEQIIDISQKIQGADNPENDTYELHRADSYDNLTDDEYFSQKKQKPSK